MALHTIVEHDTTHIKPYIDAKISSVKQALADEVEARATLGAHNLLPLSLAHIKANNTGGSWTGNTYTVNDAHFALTVDTDGDTVIDIAVTTESTGVSSQAFLVIGNGVSFRKGDYILNGSPSGSGFNSYYVYTTYNDGGIKNKADYGSGVSLQYSTDNISNQIAITVKTAVTTAVHFKPMVRTASDPSTKFTPYAMTNQQLTENNVAQSTFISVPASYHTGGSANVNFEKRNGIARVYWTGGAPLFPAQSTLYEIGNIPSGYEPKGTVNVFAIDLNSFSKGMLLRLDNGKVYIYGYSTGTDGSLNPVISDTYILAN